jgi:XTP/dITP diphosphohydrolase
MARKFAEDRLVIASHNAGKVREIGALLAPFSVEVISAGQLDIEEPEETETTFTGNATLKAHFSAKASGLPALSDDSGLVVPALNGDPGIYSARWGGPEKDFNLAMRKVEEALQASGSDDRSAYFICALCLAWPDGHEEIFEGRVDGTLVWPGRGDRGFGYDPIFVPDGFDITFGEMDPDAKHGMSHRADAFNQLVDACF